ncbi:MAG: HAD-IA family hydrolase [Propioniciclava sp.]
MGTPTETQLIATAAGLLFDMDGTLLDSTPVIEAMWANFAAEHRLSLPGILRFAHGRPTRSTVDNFLPGHPASARAAIVAALTDFEIDRSDQVAAIPGAQAFMQQAQALQAPMALVTSASRPLALSRMAAAGLPLPPVMVTADDVHQGKPHPEGYLAAAATLAVPPERCVVFEDVPHGLAAGQAAGATVILLGDAALPDGSPEARLPDFRSLSLERRDSELLLLRS